MRKTSFNINEFSLPPISLPWVVVTWCLCVILAAMVVVWVFLWAVDAQRGQCSLAVREAERMAIEVLAGPLVQRTCKIKPASTDCPLTSDWCIPLYLYEADFTWFLLQSSLHDMMDTVLFECLCKVHCKCTYLPLYFCAEHQSWVRGYMYTHIFIIFSWVSLSMVV